jgi:hypothetical protein
VKFQAFMAVDPSGKVANFSLTIATLLGHASRGITQRYVHIDEALRMAADRVADEMSDILDGKAAVARPRQRTSQQEPQKGDHARQGV